MRLIKIYILLIFVFLLNGCANENEKCVKIVNENNQVRQLPIYVYSLDFFEYLSEVMNGHPPMYYKKGKLIAENTISEVCFSSQVRSWFGGYRINNMRYNSMHFGDFDSIPSKIVLKTKKFNQINDSNFSINFKGTNFLDFNISK